MSRSTRTTAALEYAGYALLFLVAAACVAGIVRAVVLFFAG